MVSVGSNYRTNWRGIQVSAPVFLSQPIGHHLYSTSWVGYGTFTTSPLTYDGPRDKTRIIIDTCKGLTIDELETLMYQLDVLLGSKKGEKEK